MLSKTKTRVVRLSSIKTNPNVNRAVDKAWVNYLVKNWDESLMGTPQVAEENGHFIVLDGQHRLAAFGEQHADDPRVEVRVHEGMSKADMARAFVELNHGRAIKPFDKFVKLVFSGEPDAVAIEHNLHAHGLHLAQGHKPGAVSCVVALRRVHNFDHTGAVLSRVLDALTKAWGDDPIAFNGEIVTGLGLLFQRFPELNDKGLATGLAKSAGGASGLLGKGRSVREIQGGLVAGGIAEAARLIYNRGRRSGKLTLGSG